MKKYQQKQIPKIEEIRSVLRDLPTPDSESNWAELRKTIVSSPPSLARNELGVARFRTEAKPLRFDGRDRGVRQMLGVALGVVLVCATLPTGRGFGVVGHSSPLVSHNQTLPSTKVQICQTKSTLSTSVALKSRPRLVSEGRSAVSKPDPELDHPGTNVEIAEGEGAMGVKTASHPLPAAPSSREGEEANAQRPTPDAYTAFIDAPLPRPDSETPEYVIAAVIPEEATTAQTAETPARNFVMDRIPMGTPEPDAMQTEDVFDSELDPLETQTPEKKEPQPW